ncbi:MAG: phosphate acyltransferase PlsX [Clostridiales bacterium]|jgi:glycerol-3-phosphate acyltransferase PlsX|nr:phosphate acyltransferase PlsX [Clostridiales bacterium]
MPDENKNIGGITVTVAVDAMGGDNAPVAIIKGAAEAASEQKNIKILLIGQENVLSSELGKYTYEKDRLEIIPASEVILTEESPTNAIRNKKDSSMVVGLNLVKAGKAGAFVSAGSTGALLAGATVIIGRLKGIERPALAALFPNEKGYTFLIDVGANVDCKPNYLLQFGQMGSVYMEHVMGVKNPRVGLVNIGAEKEKGDALTKEAHLLLEASDLNFIGNAEARDIPGGVADVAVCDGFVGNVILKYSEGFALSLLSMIKEELMSTTASKLGALLAKGSFKNLKKRFDPSEIGGAPFLGLKGLVVKAHGSSDARAVKNAIKQCAVFIEKDIVNKLAEKV